MPLALILHIEDIAAWFKAMCHAANICFLWSGCSGVSDVVSIFMLVGMWARLVGLFFLECFGSGFVRFAFWGWSVGGLSLLWGLVG